ncbi:MAG: ribosome maturation factor RimM [Pygmaiobacter massiliensis]|nr:ribosome maturation factor RimM [Pygmaiobacter massiliensis]
MLKPYLEAGKFVTTHGVMGELKAYPYCDGPEFLCGFKRFYLSPQGGSPLVVESARVQKNVTLIKLQGVDSLEAARGYVNRMFYISRADVKLPQGRYFVQDIIGCQVKDADTDQLYGQVIEVTSNGPQDIYSVKTPDGRVVLFPAVEAFLVKTDVEAGLITVRPIEGMFTDAD